MQLAPWLNDQSDLLRAMTAGGSIGAQQQENITRTGTAGLQLLQRAKELKAMEDYREQQLAARQQLAEMQMQRAAELLDERTRHNMVSEALNRQLNETREETASARKENADTRSAMEELKRSTAADAMSDAAGAFSDLSAGDDPANVLSKYPRAINVPAFQHVFQNYQPKTIHWKGGIFRVNPDGTYETVKEAEGTTEKPPMLSVKPGGNNGQDEVTFHGTEAQYRDYATRKSAADALSQAAGGNPDVSIPSVFPNMSVPAAPIQNLGDFLRQAPAEGAAGMLSVPTLAPIAPKPAARVRVKNKDGKIGTIPAEQLDEALASGYTKVD